MPCLRERRRSARLPPRLDAERYVHTVRNQSLINLMFPMGDIVVGIGGVAPDWVVAVGLGGCGSAPGRVR